jgi:hypothetical protein
MVGTPPPLRFGGLAHPTDHGVGRKWSNEAFAEHHVLVMRDQHLGPKEFNVAA